MKDVRFRKVMSGWERIWWLAGAAQIPPQELPTMTVLEFARRIALATKGPQS